MDDDFIVDVPQEVYSSFPCGFCTSTMHHVVERYDELVFVCVNCSVIIHEQAAFVIALMQSPIPSAWELMNIRDRIP